MRRTGIELLLALVGAASTGEALIRWVGFNPLLGVQLGVEGWRDMELDTVIQASFPLGGRPEGTFVLVPGHGNLFNEEGQATRFAVARTLYDTVLACPTPKCTIIVSGEALSQSSVVRAVQRWAVGEEKALVIPELLSGLAAQVWGDDLLPSMVFEMLSAEGCTSRKECFESWIQLPPSSSSSLQLDDWPLRQEGDCVQIEWNTTQEVGIGLGPVQVYPNYDWAYLYNGSRVPVRGFEEESSSAILYTLTKELCLINSKGECVLRTPLWPLKISDAPEVRVRRCPFEVQERAQGAAWVDLPIPCYAVTQAGECRPPRCFYSNQRCSPYLECKHESLTVCRSRSNVCLWRAGACWSRGTSDI